MKKSVFESPRVLKVILIVCENNFLTDSISDSNPAIKTSGQKVQSYDFDPQTTPFNHTWEP